mgnify:CR=1 FL=1
MIINLIGKLDPAFRTPPNIESALNAARDTLNSMIKALLPFFFIDVKRVTFLPVKKGSWDVFDVIAETKFKTIYAGNSGPVYRRSEFYSPKQTRNQFIKTVFPAYYDIYVNNEKTAGRLEFVNIES